MRRRWSAGLILFALAQFVVSPARAEAPDPHSESILDGCQRSQAMILSMTTPEWVYVHHADVLAARVAGDWMLGRRSVRGIATDSKPAGDDLFVSHEFVDMNIDVAPDPANPDPGFTDLIEEGDGSTVHSEWEDGLIPMWAWPQVGDGVQESGSWIWDCGHWGDGGADPTHGISPLLPYDPAETLQDLNRPGTISGEGTELHPLFEVATFRKEAAGLLNGTPSPLQHLDAWISGDAGPALAEEECALKGVPPALAQQVCSRYRDVGGHYSYKIQLGPQPAGGTIVVNPLVVRPETDADLANLPVTITPDISAGTVSVSFDLPHQTAPDAAHVQHFGISVEAGWSNETAAVKHVVVTLDQLHIQRSLDVMQQQGGSEPNQNPVANGPEQTFGPGEWVMVAQANGHWMQLPPSLVSQVTDNQTINFDPPLTFDYYLPGDIAPRLFVSGRECDIPLIDCASDTYGAHANAVPFAEIGYNDHPGRIMSGSQHVGVVMSTGQATYKPIQNLSTNPSNGNEDKSDYTCAPYSCYQLKATLSVS
ncbi:MAG: hypothetical protein ABR507_02710 [Actinomycetota bacterium]|nr:hypothetical protein [Actinomycetota bacterium]